MAYDIFLKRGTEANYKQIASKSSDVIYFCTDTGNIYLGGKLYTGKVSFDTDLPFTGEYGILYVTGKNVYTWNGTDFVAGVPIMTAASSSDAGYEGLVPAPAAGDQTKFLKGDATWKEIETSDVDGLDTLLSKLSRLLTVTLTAANWTGDTAPYEQTVSVANLLETDNPTITKIVAADATVEDIEAYDEAFGCLISGTTANGSATFKAKAKPTIDFSVGLKGI